MYSLWGKVFGDVYQGQALIPVNMIMQFLEVRVELWDSFYTYVSIPYNCSMVTNPESTFPRKHAMAQDLVKV